MDFIEEEVEGPEWSNDEKGGHLSHLKALRIREKKQPTLDRAGGKTVFLRDNQVLVRLRN